MSVFATIQSDLVAAMKAKDELKLSAVRGLKAALQKTIIDSKGSADDDALAITVLKQEAKKRADSITTYTQGGRADLANKEQAELEIIKQYLPAQLSDTAVREQLKPLVVGATTKDFGQLMKQAMLQLQNQADGKQVAIILKELLTV
ncbi:MAG: hypothetical protein ACD_43C00282G0004 [uncultured bacterium]|nr:MAG: hypothetical protein ACD_43C00282G0004 [uncultured bacterium]